MQIEIDPKRLDIFSTPVIITELPDCETLNRELESVIYAKKKSEDEGVARSNIMGWHSRYDMLTWGGEAAQTILDLAIAVCERYCVIPHGDKDVPFAWKAEMWANVSSYGSANHFHMHGHSLWSAVYYVVDGYEGGDGEGLGGHLQLRDPRYPTPYMHASRARLIDPDNKPLTTGHHSIVPKPGLMVAFPGWLSHAVDTFLGTGDRISIAVNLDLLRSMSVDKARRSKSR